MKKIYLDAGHGGTDSGAPGNGLLEKNITLKIQQHMITLLNTYYTGFAVNTTRTTDVFLSLSERASKANSWGADVFMSIHVNAGGGSGYEDYIYRATNRQETINFRNSIHEQVKPVLSAYNHANRGRKSANYAVLRQTNMPAVLAEIAFIDTVKDANLLKNDAFLQDMANAYVRGIAQFLQLNEKVSSPSTPSKQPLAAETPPDPSTLPKVTSLGDAYAVEVRAKVDTGLYRYANLPNRQRTIKAGTVFRVYGYTYASWTVGNGEDFVQMKDVELILVTLITGGLNSAMEQEFRDFLKTLQLDGELNLKGTGNPSGEITVGGLELVRVKQFLDEKGWYYKEA
ncbi:N-acetylmuramoyl-L-alanine amidase [Priestia megaterium]|nr:N-acetylmuramoyl-L-alanine amidase [Priestia megaterium]